MKGSLLKKQKWAVGSALLIALCVASALVVTAFTRSSHAVVGHINGDSVSAEWFRMQLQQEAAGTFQYFHEQYGAEDSAEFWNRAHGGEVPIEHARRAAKRNLVAVMVQLQLAKAHGLLDDIRYETFEQELKEENERRREALATGKIIYGPTEYAEPDFFNYRFSNLVIRLKEKLRESDFRMSDEELRRMYEFDKRSFSFMNKRVVRVSVPTGEDGAKAAIEEARNRALEEENGEASADAYRSPLKAEEFLFDNRAGRADYAATGVSREVANPLTQGQVSGIYKENGFYCFLKVVELFQAEFPDFESRVDAMKQEHTEQEYARRVDRLVREAKTEWNPEALKRMKIR
ncbi:hypothetical protein B0G52_119132 [Cohnella sp. SGD-V74]|uniref:peptidylprolyl isomerase n=1 Tax=unclassified Cohnella TaxID=2636738 RepID=UPI000D42D6A8|nr:MULTISPECIES: peptidylprolyl isomerase [unclassified Cohnella]PRX64593.1 hypothetical protein B0G52_119132 [Cohnella sp. SGD-V74]